MSTTFGIKIISKDNTSALTTLEPVAFRHGIGNGKVNIRFTCGRKREIMLALLDDEHPVYPMDNTAQGISTIGDIRKVIKEQQELKKKIK